MANFKWGDISLLSRQQSRARANMLLAATMVRIVNILSLLFIKLRKHILTVMDVRFIGLETESHGMFWVVV